MHDSLKVNEYLVKAKPHYGEFSPFYFYSIHSFVASVGGGGAGDECESSASPTTASSVSTATGARRKSKRQVWKRPPVPLDKVIEADDAAALVRYPRGA